MVDVRVTPELVKDLNELLLDFGTFMSMNLVHADQNSSGDARLKIQELMQYSSENFKNTIILKTPVSNYMNYNIKIVSENLTIITKFMYDYLKYAEPIVKKLLPSRLSRIDSLKKDYTKFMKKYF